MSFDQDVDSIKQKLRADIERREEELRTREKAHIAYLLTLADQLDEQIQSKRLSIEFEDEEDEPPCIAFYHNTTREHLASLWGEPEDKITFRAAPDEAIGEETDYFPGEVIFDSPEQMFDKIIDILKNGMATYEVVTDCID